MLFKTDNPQCKYSLYYSVFTKEFNLGFGSPRSDVCGLCEKLRSKIKLCSDATEKKNMITEFMVHKRRAKYFYTLINRDDVLEPCLTVAFDMQQNQPLPKVSVSEAFYARQLWVYNLTFVIHKGRTQNKDQVFIYTWDETQSGRDSNHVASALLHFLINLDIPAGVNKIRLFSDACASQNRNSTIICICHYFCTVVKPNFVIEHYFPVRGHSFLPPDRVFGRMEKVFRKIEVFLIPADYHKIYEDFGVVRLLGRNWNLFDYKVQAHKLLKANLGLGIAQVKVIRFESGKVGVKNVYNGEFSWHIIGKRGKKINSLQNTPLALESSVKPAKASDVAKLLVSAGVLLSSRQDIQSFYASVSSAVSVDASPDIENDDDADILEEFDSCEAEFI